MSEQTIIPSNWTCETDDRMTRRALLAAGVFGFGFSGLIDVIVLHSILQWHHLVSAIYPTDTLNGLRRNIFADGLFSMGMLIIMGIGGGLLWQSERRTDVPLAVRPLVGAAVFGLGVFNLYDAIVDHVLLGLHQPLSQGGYYNPHWAAISFIIMAAGVYIYRSSVKSRAEEGTESA